MFKKKVSGYGYSCKYKKQMGDVYFDLRDAYVIKYSDDYAFINCSEFDTAMYNIANKNFNAQQAFWYCLKQYLFQFYKYEECKCVYLHLNEIKNFNDE